jgi:aspartyl-tRNA(Asn)/glutamyl-tRNA(Gln) amidotransferase subunit B
VRKLSEELGIRESDAEVLLLEEDISRYFDEARTELSSLAQAGAWQEEQGVSRLVNFLLSEVLREWNRKGSSILSGGLRPGEIAYLVSQVMEERLSLNQAKEVYSLCIEELRSPKTVIQEKNLSQESGEERLGEWIGEVLTENPVEVQAYREGKDRVFGFLVGQVMKKSGGKAHPQKANRLLKDALGR